MTYFIVYTFDTVQNIDIMDDTMFKVVLIHVYAHCEVVPDYFTGRKLIVKRFSFVYILFLSKY